jgi:hypothetical protein
VLVSTVRLNALRSEQQSVHFSSVIGLLQEMLHNRASQQQILDRGKEQVEDIT